MWRKYFSLTRAGILDSLQFRLSLIFTVVGNLLYLLLIYYLWRAIFASVDSPVINGMTFSDTMVYLVFASALFNFMEMWIVWTVGREIQEGKIVIDLLRPMNYLTYIFFRGFGEVVVKFLLTFLPTAIVVFFVSDGAIPVGTNLIYFAISVCFSLLINYYINFFVATICMHTESIWGINIMKEVIVGILSGATVPLAFFPQAFRSIAMVLPFQTIINSPLQLLLHPEYTAVQCLQILGLQLIWLVVLRLLAEWFFRVSLKKITVNGG
ncbi:MAG: ABC-2 family transporter protein [bacterium]|nr:ABC-2 family transporter protein [bacterium]